MDLKKLKKLIQSPESPKLDFKAELHLDFEMQKRELVKDVSAMANSKGGRGYIIYGIADKTREIIGIDPTLQHDTEERIQQILCNRVDPPVPVRFEMISIDGKFIGVLTIFKSGQQPHQVRQSGSFYIRRGSTTDIARRREVADMLQEAGIVSCETVIFKKASLEDLDQELLKKYLAEAKMLNEELNMLLLEALGIIAKEDEYEGFHPTVGGLLLFGKQPESYLPHTKIKVIIGEEITYFSGNLIKMLDTAQEFIQNRLSSIGYPIEALYEALQNAVIHRDYWDTTREIVVDIGMKYITIENPGALWTTGDIKSLFKEANPPRRNPWLYQRLLVLDDKKRFLHSVYGMKRMQQIFPSQLRVNFSNLTSKNIFRVQFPGLKHFI